MQNEKRAKRELFLNFVNRKEPKQKLLLRTEYQKFT